MNSHRSTDNSIEGKLPELARAACISRSLSWSPQVAAEFDPGKLPGCGVPVPCCSRRRVKLPSLSKNDRFARD
jgi:hypothetical protein